MKRQNIKPSFDWSGHVILFFSFQSRDYVNEPHTVRKKKWIQYFDTLKNDQNSFPILFQKKVSFLNEVLKKVRNYYFISI